VFVQQQNELLVEAEGGGGEEEGAAGGGANQELRRGVGVLMDAMRDLLNNIRMAPPPLENGQPVERQGEGGDEAGEEEEEEVDEWD
jgi:hypothetical protein